MVRSSALRASGRFSLIVAIELARSTSRVWSPTVRSFPGYVLMTAPSGFTSARKPQRLPRWVRWTCSAEIVLPAGPFTPIAAVASESTVTRKPRWAACRAVVSTHICVIKPASTTRSIPWARRSSSSFVPVNEPGRSFCTTGSPDVGRASGWISSAGLPGAKIAAFGFRLSWTTWMTGSFCSLAHLSASAMRLTAAGPPGSTTLPRGAKYSADLPGSLPAEGRAVAYQHEAREPAAHANETRPALGVGPEAPHERRRPVEAVVDDVPAVDRAEVVGVELHQAQEDGRVLPARLTELDVHGAMLRYLRCDSRAR